MGFFLHFAVFLIDRETSSCMEQCQMTGTDPQEVNTSLKNMRKVRAKFALDDETYEQLLNEPDPLVAMAVKLGFPIAKKVSLSIDYYVVGLE